jgi:hypothetical protein
LHHDPRQLPGAIKEALFRASDGGESYAQPHQRIVGRIDDALLHGE